MITYQKNTFPVVCGCGREHFPHSWYALVFVGIQEGIDRDTGRRFWSDLELRNCTCGSTLSAMVEEP